MSDFYLSMKVRSPALALQSLAFITETYLLFSAASNMWRGSCTLKPALSPSCLKGGPQAHLEPRKGTLFENGAFAGVTRVRTEMRLY